MVKIPEKKVFYSKITRDRLINTKERKRERSRERGRQWSTMGASSKEIFSLQVAHILAHNA